VVVTVVAAFFVQRHQEEVGLLQPFQHLPSVGRVRECVAQGTAKGLDDGGLEQELPNVLRLLGKDFVGQVVEDVAGAPSDSLDGTGVVFASSEGVRR
jgi:hypothetical protein